jgi:hypothetical protein
MFGSRKGKAMDVKALESALNLISKGGNDQTAINALLQAAQASAELPDEIKQAVLSLAARDGRFGADSLIKTISAGWC